MAEKKGIGWLEKKLKRFILVSRSGLDGESSSFTPSHAMKGGESTIIGAQLLASILSEARSPSMYSNQAESWFLH